MPTFSSRFTSQPRRRNVGPGSDKTDFVLQSAGVPIPNGSKRELSHGLFFGADAMGWPYIVVTSGDWKLVGQPPLVVNAVTYVDKNDRIVSDKQKYEHTFEPQVLNGQKYLMIRGRALGI